jgi:DNA-binding transcriptional MerR regulator
VSSSAEFLNPSEAARRLGVSAKALRLYEQRGLVAPVRTAAGWRAYGPGEMTRAAEIASLRALGLSLAQVARVLGGDSQSLEPALAAHQATLEGRIRQVADAIEKVRGLRADLARGPPSESWCSCWGRRPGSASRSRFPGPGAANSSSCATSSR